MPDPIRPIDCIFKPEAMNSNDSVLQSLKIRLQSLAEKYKEQPDELNRYRLACHEQLILRWASDQLMEE
jgi:hypothetical protein